mmetsp:Transcript_39551/g.44528  ORF Transcript_39551/g.44528 Transcript_39551/m.44528 type:complete len:199 (+) Transcript_39551:1032-1628(+)
MFSAVAALDAFACNSFTISHSLSSRNDSNDDEDDVDGLVLFSVVVSSAIDIEARKNDGRSSTCRRCRHRFELFVVPFVVTVPGTTVKAAGATATAGKHTGTQAVTIVISTTRTPTIRITVLAVIIIATSIPTNDDVDDDDDDSTKGEIHWYWPRRNFSCEAAIMMLAVLLSFFLLFYIIINKEVIVLRGKRTKLNQSA